MSETRHTIDLAGPVCKVATLSRFQMYDVAEEDEVCQAARAAGYREGFEAAAQSAQEAAQGERERWSKDLQSILESLHSQEEGLARQFEQAIPDIVLIGIRRVLDGFEPDRATLERIVSSAIDEYPREEANLTIRLHPADCSLIEDLLPTWSTRSPGLRMLADDSLQRGDCIVNGRFGITDARLETKLSNIKGALV